MSVQVERFDTQNRKLTGRAIGPKNLAPASIHEVRALLWLGWKQREVAAHVGISMSQVAHISAGHTYWWLESEPMDLLPHTAEHAVTPAKLLS